MRPGGRPPRPWALPVGPEDRAVTFRMPLEAGPVRLQTWLTDADGNAWGAYYVYVERAT